MFGRAKDYTKQAKVRVSLWARKGEDMIRIGCIADDFTGAGDWASFFAEKKIRTLLFNGIPDESCRETADVVVIALKTRALPREEAVQESIRALRWLKEQGTERFYIKYCSTFDCRPEGNIGPVIDAALDELGENVTIVCPALPVNGRTVKDGKLYVNGKELQESHMKDHPLNPMWDCRIGELLRRQSRGETVTVPADGYEHLQQTRSRLKKSAEGENRRIYFVPDFYREEHGAKIAELFRNMKVLTGGSGLCSALADQLQPSGTEGEASGSAAGAVVLAGSCSQRTLEQIERYKETGGTAVFIDPLRMLQADDGLEAIWERYQNAPEDALLFYSSQKPEEIRQNQSRAGAQIAGILEGAMAELAYRFLRKGRKRIIVAGGETSGAVTRRAGYRSYYIGESIAPGVPVMIPTSDREVRLVLKSGNFGDPDFFLKALERTGKRHGKA